MKKVMWLILLCVSLASACTKVVSMEEFVGIYPGMSCADLESYLGNNKIPFKKEGKAYKFNLREDVWEQAVVTCDGSISLMEFNSTMGSSPKHSQAYIDAQQSLLNAFRDNMIIYEEGNKIINLNNGIKLHQFADTKSGIVTHFKISVASSEESKLAWEKASPLLPKVGSSR